MPRLYVFLDSKIKIKYIFRALNYISMQMIIVWGLLYTRFPILFFFFYFFPLCKMREGAFIAFMYAMINLQRIMKCGLETSLILRKICWRLCKIVNFKFSLLLKYMQIWYQYAGSTHLFFIIRKVSLVMENFSVD